MRRKSNDNVPFVMPEKHKEIVDFYNKVIDKSKVPDSIEKIVVGGTSFKDGREVNDKNDFIDQTVFMSGEAALFSSRLYILGKILQVSPKGIIDIGCGTGLAREGMRRNMYYGPYIGIDLRHKMLPMIEKDKNSRFVCTDIINNWPKKSSADFVIFSEVLEHLDKTSGEKVLSFIKDSLIKGGIVAITVPTYRANINYDKEFKKFGHVYYWKIPELLSYLDKLGFEVIEKWPTKFMGDRKSLKKIAKLYEDRYGSAAMPVLDDLTARFGKLIAKSIMYHMIAFEDATAIQMLCKKK